MLPSTPRFSNRSPDFSFPTKILHAFVFSHTNATGLPAHPPCGTAALFHTGHTLVTLLTCVLQHGAGSWTDVAGAIIKIPALCHKPRRQWARAWNKRRTNQYSAQTGVQSYRQKVKATLAQLWRRMGAAYVQLHQFLVSGFDGREWSVSHSGRFTPPHDIAPSMHWILGWEDTRVDVGVCEMRRIKAWTFQLIA